MALDPATGWSYYKEIQISDTANVSADYQMKLTVYAGAGSDNVADGIIYCDNRCEDFPNDIRFGTTNDPSTATQLAQWIEESDATSAIIWVKLPSDGSNTFYMFVGNSSASKYSDENNTWIFYEEWTTDYTSQYIEKKRNAIEDYGHFRSISGVSIPYRQLAKVKIHTWDYNKYGSQAWQGTSNDIDDWRPSNAIFTHWSCDTDDGAGASTVAWYIESIISGTGYASSKQTFSFSVDTWYKNEIKVTSSQIEARVYSNDYSSTLASAILSNVPSSTGAYNYYGEYTADSRTPGKSWAYHGDPDYCIGYGGYRGSTSHIELYSSWTCIGKYASTEPTWSSFGSWTEIGGGGGQAYETTLTDTISLSDSTQKLISILRSDNLTLTDIKTITPAVMKSDLLTLSDGKLLEIVKLLQDSLSLTDIKIATPTIEKTTAITLTDELSNMLSKLNSEQLVLIENLLNSPRKIGKETITLSDAIKNQINLYKSELINLQDSIATTIAIIKEEIISLSDNISKLSSILKSESIPLSDSIITEAKKEKILEETINLLDSLIKTIDHLIEDNFTISDSIEKQLQILRQDSLSFIDSITKTAGIEKSEEISISDLKQLQMQTTKLETISILIENLNQINLTEKEIINLIDVISREIRKEIIENIELIEKLINEPSRIKRLSETITLTDNIIANISAILRILRAFTEQQEGVKAEIEQMKELKAFLERVRDIKAS